MGKKQRYKRKYCRGKKVKRKQKGGSTVSWYAPYGSSGLGWGVSGRRTRRI